MKKIFVLFLALVIAFSLAACGRPAQENSSGNDTASENEAAQTDAPEADGAVEVDGEQFTLDFESNHRDLYFKTDIVNISKDSYGSVCDLRYFKEGELLFVIHLVYFENKSIEDVMAESDNELSAKTVGNLEYQYFEYDENGMPGHTYLYTYNGNSYTVSFASNADISALEQAFMESVHFGEQ